MKSKKERIDWQKRVKTEHKDRIISLLKERKTMRFKDFITTEGIQKTGIRSPKGLTEVLDRLMNEEKLIEKTHIEIEKEGESERGLHGETLKKNVKKRRVEAYQLTEKGQKYEAWWLIHELLDLQGQQAGYLHTLSSKYYGMGLSEDIVMGHGNGKPLDFLIPPLPQIEDFIMGKLVENIQKQKEKIEPSTGKFIISFEFDYAELSNALIEMQNAENGDKK